MSDSVNDEVTVTAESEPEVALPAGLLRIKVYSPFITYFKGDAKSLSAATLAGPFDILPGHHNFIALLKPCDIQIALPDEGMKTIEVSRGLMHVRLDHVTIFLDV